MSGSFSDQTIHLIERFLTSRLFRSLHNLFNSKKTAATVQMIAADSGDPKRLWWVVVATLGLSQPSDIQHSTDQFSDYRRQSGAHLYSYCKRTITDVMERYS